MERLEQFVNETLVCAIHHTNSVSAEWSTKAVAKSDLIFALKTVGIVLEINFSKQNLTFTVLSNVSEQ
jgi:hypothetical protein